jgi:DNA replicative helicase MCM subunit Mcm2 (Cdc46/Mcm family)
MNIVRPLLTLYSRGRTFSTAFKGNSLAPSVMKNRGITAIEAGFLLLNNSGVSHIPEMSALKKKDALFLEQAMEKPEIGELPLIEC